MPLDTLVIPPKIQLLVRQECFHYADYFAVCNAHMVDTHSCRPGFRPSHIVLFTGRSAQSSLATEVVFFRQSLLRATRSRVGARNDVMPSSSLAGALAMPLPQPFPTDLREFSGRRHPRDLRA